MAAPRTCADARRCIGAIQGVIVMNVNHFMVGGNLTRDPELRLPDGLMAGR